ncbi:hypothetical protein KY360_04785 [Candidatus Woesearchaeota archaeon]|nr:hypothetical protein [Candidatus Woesearchaeota archaeon]
MADEEPKWSEQLNIPAGEHWLDESVGAGFYTDIKEITDLLDEGKEWLAEKALRDFPKPKKKKEIAEWYYVNARVQLWQGEHRSALGYSNKALKLWPGNPRYEKVHEKIKAYILNITMTGTVSDYYKFEANLEGRLSESGSLRKRATGTRFPSTFSKT